MRRIILLLALTAVVAACSNNPGSANVQAQVASNQFGIGLGDQRVLVALIDLSTSQFVASPDVEVVATLRDSVGAPLGQYDGEFVWIVPDVRGLYAFNFNFPEAATYQVTVNAGSLGETGPVGVIASENPRVVGVGEEAPLSVTRTSHDHSLRDITSDPNPDPAFYELTVAEAVEAGPSVIVFGTPAWCASGACGPLLEQVKTLSGQFPGLNFVHVEIFEDIHVASRDELVPVPSVEEWGLVSEPIIFVTDRGGIVSASFEGAASDRELREAFAAVNG